MGEALDELDVVDSRLLCALIEHAQHLRLDIDGQDRASGSDAARELEILTIKAPEAPENLSREIVGFVQALRAELPDAEVGAKRLVGAWFGVAAEPAAMGLVQRLVDDLGGRSFPVADVDRATYHAAAVVASNHLVALMGQVARLADAVGVPLEAYLDLAAGSLDNVRGVGPSAALTGPAARGDEETVAAHLAALPADERATYRALATEARRLAGRPEPGAGT